MNPGLHNPIRPLSFSFFFTKTSIDFAMWMVCSEQFYKSLNGAGSKQFCTKFAELFRVLSSYDVQILATQVEFHFICHLTVQNGGNP